MWGFLIRYNMSEKAEQTKMIMWFSQQYPERRGDVIATFNETVNAIQGANHLALGLIPGTSDLLHVDSEKHLIGIENKYVGTYHSTEHLLMQCKFILNNCYHGFFCLNLDMFKEIILSDGKTGGILPETIMMACREKLSKVMPIETNDTIDDMLFKCNQWRDKEYPKRKKKNPKLKKADVIPPKVKF